MRNFAEQIDVTNTEQIMNYGSAAQKNISEFSDAALDTVRTKDLGEVGDMLSDLVVELKGMNFKEEKKGFLGLFKKGTQNIAALKAQYDKAEVNVDKIVEALEKHEVTLLKDISMMDKMYEQEPGVLQGADHVHLSPASSRSRSCARKSCPSRRKGRGEPACPRTPRPPTTLPT